MGFRAANWELRGERSPSVVATSTYCRKMQKNTKKVQTHFGVGCAVPQVLILYPMTVQRNVYNCASCASLAEFGTALASVGATLGGLGDHWRAMKERDFHSAALTSNNFPTCLVSAAQSFSSTTVCGGSRSCLSSFLQSEGGFHCLNCPSPCAVFNCKPFPASIILPPSGETLIWAGEWLGEAQ